MKQEGEPDQEERARARGRDIKQREIVILE